jgi:hypothetical protein
MPPIRLLEPDIEKGFLPGRRILQRRDLERRLGLGSQGHLGLAYGAAPRVEDFDLVPEPAARPYSALGWLFGRNLDITKVDALKV